MKESARNALRKVQALTESKCRTCVSASPHRCCDKMFCDFVEKGLAAIGVRIPRTGHPSIPFMGEKGCVVPAEYRPGCSGYVCESHLQKDRKFRREWSRLHDKFVRDETVDRLMSASLDVTQTAVSKAFREVS